jgi:hypothetical protein
VVRLEGCWKQEQEQQTDWFVFSWLVLVSHLPLTQLGMPSWISASYAARSLAQLRRLGLDRRHPKPVSLQHFRSFLAVGLFFCCGLDE